VLVRLLGAGVAWLAAVISFAALLQWSDPPRPELLAARDGVSALARSLNAIRQHTAHGRYTWTVTKAVSAHRELVIEVDALHPMDAPQIAERLVDAVSSRYDEVLVYVQALDKSREPLVRRIEWTPRRGYLASAF
jgi:hypothetical protein